jgi:hypothetical protein
VPPIDGIDQWDVLMKPNATSVESLRIGPFASIISHVLRSKVAAVNFTQTRSGQVIRTKQPDKTLSVCVCIFCGSDRGALGFLSEPHRWLRQLQSHRGGRRLETKRLDSQPRPPTCPPPRPSSCDWLAGWLAAGVTSTTHPDIVHASLMVIDLL